MCDFWPYKRGLVKKAEFVKVYTSGTDTRLRISRQDVGDMDVPQG
jgi:hypothetical protein